MASQLGGKDTAERIIDRYELTGGGAEAVTDVFAPPRGSSTSLGILGFLFMLVAVLSFTRGVQRLIEQTWELDPLSVRNTVNGLLWIGAFALYLAPQRPPPRRAGAQPPRARRGAGHTPLTAVFLVWSGLVLSANRIERRKLLPFGILGAVLLAVYSVGATVYVPHLFSSYATATA